MSLLKSKAMDTYFSELGRTVYDKWKAKDFSLTEFPMIARMALEKKPPARHVDLDQLLRDFLLDDNQPFQTSSGFGQPELIVYDCPKFYIQILFWLDGTTDIHQHSFSGAFHVLAGSSIHSRFDFTDVSPITPHFQLGDLKLRDTHLLEKGCTVPIHSGHGFIHSLFHLETPSVTVVIRTHSDPGTDPQFTYLPPHVALDPLKQDALTTRRKQLLDVLEQTEDENYAPLIIKMLNGLDFERGFFILQNCVATLRHLGFWEKALETFARKHGQLALLIAPTLDEIIRRDGITALRASFEDVEHRFFLALLLNVGSRTEILRMISAKMNEEALRVITRWAGELIRVTESGIWLLDACFPLVFGEDDDPEQEMELILDALVHFISGEKPSSRLRKLSKPNLESLKTTLRHSSWRNLLLLEKSSSSRNKSGKKKAENNASQVKKLGHPSLVNG